MQTNKAGCWEGGKQGPLLAHCSFHSLVFVSDVKSPLYVSLQVNEDLIRESLLSEAADEALELDTDHATPTLKEIVCAVPPQPPYAKYHEAYLRRWVGGGGGEGGGGRHGERESGRDD